MNEPKPVTIPGQVVCPRCRKLAPVHEVSLINFRVKEFEVYIDDDDCEVCPILDMEPLSDTAQIDHYECGNCGYVLGYSFYDEEFVKLVKDQVKGGTHNET